MGISVTFSDGSVRYAEPVPGRDSGLMQLAISEAQLEEVRRSEAGVLRVHFSMPIVDLHGYWKPDCFRVVLQLAWSIELYSSANKNMPFLSFFNRRMKNRLAFYSDDLADDAKITAKMNQQNCCYDVTFEQHIAVDCAPLHLYWDCREEVALPDTLSTAREIWQQSGAYALPASGYPAGAWEAVYCTWYAVHAALSDEYLKANLRLAAALGFGTFIVDDGWSYPTMKQVSPKTISTWYEEIGRWQTVDDSKLPNFKASVALAHQLKLQYLLWCAPFFCGAKKPEYVAQEGKFLAGEAGSYGVFDPADEKESSRVLHELTQLVTENHLDGLKIDFLAHVPPDLKHPHGRDALHFIQTLSQEIRAIHPEALLEFRQFYATPGMLGCATQFRANDTPFDWIENFQRIVQLRMMLGDGVPVHSDPAYWTQGEYPENIACHMLAAMAGVPMLSIELRTLSDEERTIVQIQLACYRRWVLPTARTGHWEMIFASGMAQVLSVRDQDTLCIWTLDGEMWRSVAERYDGKRILLFNLSNDSLRLEAPWRRMIAGDGTPCLNQCLPSGGTAFTFEA